jgi:predicted nucleic acid-binding protein
LKEAIVTDSTCLIALERLGRLDILPSLFEPIYAPPEVSREFGTSLPWLQVVELADPDRVVFLSASVDAGEAEAIVLARERGLKVVLDDLRARRLAHRFELEVIGTLGILVRAKRQGILDVLRPLLDQMENFGFHMSSELKEEVLRQAGEPPT